MLVSHLRVSTLVSYWIFRRDSPHVAGTESWGDPLAHRTPVIVCVPSQQVCASKELHAQRAS